MKRVSAAALLCCVAFSSAGAGAATQATPKPHHAVKAKKIVVHYAPADEYFGPLKLSLLGIRNELHDLSLQYDVNPDSRKAIYGKATTAEVSLRDWEKKYSTDPALARDVYLLAHLDGKIGLAEAQKHVPAVQHWLIAKYPSSWYAKDEKKRIAYEKAHPHPKTVEAKATPAGMEATAAPAVVATQVPATPTPPAESKHGKKHHGAAPEVAATSTPVSVSTAAPEAVSTATPGTRIP